MEMNLYSNLNTIVCLLSKKVLKFILFFADLVDLRRGRSNSEIEHKSSSIFNSSQGEA